MANNGFSTPRYRTSNRRRKQRKCLMCGRMFNSSGPEHRICERHRETRKRTKYDDWAEIKYEDWEECE